MKYNLFLGCTIPTRARNYELSTRKVAQAMGIEFIDMPESSCCGFPIKSVHEEGFLLMAARNLILAEKNGEDICTPCSACTSVLTEVNRELKEDDEIRKRINEKLSKLNGKYTFQGKIKVKHFARLLYEDVGVEKIRSMVKKDLSALKVAVHYGCHYLKPSDIYNGFDNPEDPKSLDELIEATGASLVNYMERKRCCGGAVLAVNEEVSLTIAREKLDDIKAAGAEAMVLVCPFCSVMYDDNQRKIEAKFSTEYNLPVFYYPQLLGLALGMEPRALGLNMNRVKMKPLLEKLASD